MVRVLTNSTRPRPATAFSECDDLILLGIRNQLSAENNSALQFVHTRANVVESNPRKNHSKERAIEKYSVRVKESRLMNAYDLHFCVHGMHFTASKQTTAAVGLSLLGITGNIGIQSSAALSLTAYPRFALHRSLYRARSCISTHTLRLPSSTRAPNVTQLPHTQQTQSAYYIATCFHINGHWTSHRFSVCITALFVSHRSPFFQFLLNCNTTLVYWLL